MIERRKTVLFAALVIGALLRFHDLGQVNFWADEDLAVETQYRTAREIVAERAERSGKINVEPPGYHLVNAVVRRLVPEPRDAFTTERGRFLLRLFSALAGVLSVYLMYLLARRFAPPGWAALPALLFAFSFYSVYYSQENRPYSATIALAILSTWLFVEAFFHGRRALAPAYAVAVAALCYMHYAAALAPVAHATAFAIAALTRARVENDDGEPLRIGRADALVFAGTALFALALFSPWIAHTLRIALRPSDYFASAHTPAVNFPYMPPKLVLSVLAHFGCGGRLSLATYLPLAAVGFIGLARRAGALAILAAMFYLAPLAFLAFSPYSIYIAPRYLIVLFPMHQLLAALGVIEAAVAMRKIAAALGFARRAGERADAVAVAILITVLAVMNAVALKAYYRRDIKCSSENRIETTFCPKYIDQMK